MLYSSYTDLRMYNNQMAIGFPKGQKTNDDQDGQSGKGQAIFLISPNQNASLELIDNPKLQFRQSRYRWYYTDQYFQGRIGTKVIHKNEIATMRKAYKDEKHPLMYLASGTKQSILSKNLNMVVDLGKWMEYYFTYYRKTNARMICEKFTAFLSEKINDSSFSQYKKYLLLDLASWNKSVKQFILLNPKLLTDPLTILFYTAYKFPEMLTNFPDCEIILIDSLSGQLMKFPSNLLKTKKTFQKIKTKMKLFRNVEISTEDETEEVATPITNTEVKAEIIEDAKKELRAQIVHNLLGPTPTPSAPITNDADDVEDVDTPPDDITKDILDEEDDIDVEPDDIAEVDDLDAEVIAAINKSVDDYIDEQVKHGEPIEVDTKAISEISARVARSTYKASFIPEHDEKELAKIQQYAEAQGKVIKPPTYHDVKTKVIDETPIDNVVKTRNPNIKKSKYLNFDKGYNEKKMEADIDSAVAVLSKADYKLFVTGKEVEDSSDNMNLKKTYTYHLVDEGGKKSTLKFDIPVIIDNNYIYLNGSKKVIHHQFLMKPLVKTSPNEVWMVTWYNKVSIQRAGKYDTLTALIHAYLTKNSSTFNVKFGNGYIKNQGKDTSLDYDMYAKIFYEFTINGTRFIFDIDYLLAQAKLAGCDVSKINLKKVVPIGFKKSTKEIFTIPHGGSFTNTLINFFTETDQKAIYKIKKKPSLITVDATILKKKSSTGKSVPLILFLFFCEGFKSVMDKAKIEYKFVDNKEALKNYNPREWGFVNLTDTTIAWKREPFSNTMLMNSLSEFPIGMYGKEDLESKDTYTYLISRYYTNPNIAYALDNFKNFMIDDATVEILQDYGYPTDLVDLFIYAVKLLENNQYSPETDMNNARVRSNEVIANILYSEVTMAYHNYRRTIHRKKPLPISIKQSGIIDKLLSDDVRMVDEFSSLNPVLELEKGRAISFKGLRGIQVDRAYTLEKRGYDKSMLGVVGISTSPKLVGR